MFESQEEYDYAMQAEAEAEMEAAAKAAEGEAEQARILAEQKAKTGQETIQCNDLLACRLGKAHIKDALKFGGFDNPYDWGYSEYRNSVKRKNNPFCKRCFAFWHDDWNNGWDNAEIDCVGFPF